MSAAVLLTAVLLLTAAVPLTAVVLLTAAVLLTAIGDLIITQPTCSGDKGGRGDSKGAVPREAFQTDHARGVLLHWSLNCV